MAFGSLEAIARFLPGARHSEISSSGAESCWEIRGDVGRDLTLDTGKGGADVEQGLEHPAPVEMSLESPRNYPGIG